MSKLKISDLSFCETELSPNSQVQGGSRSLFSSDLRSDLRSNLRAFFRERFEVLRETVFNSADDFGVTSQIITEGELSVEVTQFTSEEGTQIIRFSLESSSP